MCILGIAARVRFWVGRFFANYPDLWAVV